MRVVRERPSNGPEWKRYRNSRSQAALYSAASRLWMKGVNMAQAVEIVSEAVAEASRV